uniref:Phosphatidate cytidylyltransferase, mitochondrial n=1 Tax=Plectus sambesii TaxID=2011161 RepID=A0A914W844_9BILA
MDTANVEEVKQLISCLPQETIDLAFAYGSGAMPQTSSDLKNNMVDFIVAVSDAEAFHRENLKRNRRHYSAIKYFGAIANANFQRKYAAHVFYNTLVKTENGREIKYGLIETGHLIADLLDWDYLYVSGRLHKPTLRLTEPKSMELESALDVNLKSAVHAALLLLPESFTLEQLFTKISSISYQGDFRSTVGEDRNKVAKIVKANMSRFDALYKPYLAANERVVVNGQRVEQDGSTTAVYHHLNLLPSAVLWRLQESVNRRQMWNRDLEEVIFSLAHRRDYSTAVYSAINSIVRHSSRTQSVKNIVTAGVWKTTVYALRKLGKMARSM